MLVLMRHLSYELHTDEDNTKIYIATNQTGHLVSWREKEIFHIR